MSQYDSTETAKTIVINASQQYVIDKPQANTVTEYREAVI